MTNIVGIFPKIILVKYDTYSCSSTKKNMDKTDIMWRRQPSTFNMCQFFFVKSKPRNKQNEFFVKIHIQLINFDWNVYSLNNNIIMNMLCIYNSK